MPLGIKVCDKKHTSDVYMEEQQLQTCLPLIIYTNKIQKQKLPGGCNLHLILSFVTCTMATTLYVSKYFSYITVYTCSTE